LSIYQFNARAAYYRRIAELDVPPIFVTNCPYRELISPDAAKTVLVTFSSLDHSMVAAADVISGKLKLMAKLDFDPAATIS
jgi:hypothetical protein